MTPKKAKLRQFLIAAAPYITAYMVPVLVMLIIFIQRGIWPFGQKCFLRTDLYHQYAPFYREFREKLFNGGSLFYSWHIGSGTNFWAIIAYYLSSPLNFFMILLGKDFTIEYITGMIVMKLGLMSATCTYYINSRHKNTGIRAYPAVFFGTFYALSGYTAAYSWNIMWLDCLWLFPLLLLGVEKMMKEEKGILYCVTLGLSFVSNYYIAIISSMGVFVYCFYLLATEKEMLKNFWRKFGKFMGFTVLGILLSAFLLFPYIKYFPMTASAEDTFTWKWNSYFSIFDILSRQLFSVEVHTGLDHWPNIYCGVFVFLGLPLYYMNRRITLKEKIASTVLLLFFFFSFSTRSMDYMWHVLHIPNSLPCRQGYIYIFLLLVLCYRGFMDVKDRSYRELGACMLAGILFVIAAEKLETDTEYYQNYVFYGSAVFMILYTLILYGYKKGRIYRDILLGLALAAGMLEALINTSVTSVTTVTRSDYISFDEGVSNIMAEIEEEEEGSFYRVEKAKYRTKNDGAWLQYNSISTFSSVGNANLTAFYKTIGLESSYNAYGSMGQTFFTNMLLGVKYVISDKEMHTEDGLFTLYDEDSGVYVYENEYVLPLGYMLSPDVLSSWVSSGASPLINQNQLASLVSGVNNLFEDVTPVYYSDTTVTMTVETAGYYYAYSPKTGTKEIEVTNGDWSRTYKDLNRDYTMELYWCDEGDVLTFTNAEEGSSKKLDISLYLFHAEKMPEVYEAFSENTMNIVSWSDTRIEATVTVEDPGDTLFTTIPYEEGWSLYVDGEKYNIYAAKDTYIAADLLAGEHTLVFEYHVPLFGVGMALTLAAVLTLGGIIFLKMRKKRVAGDGSL